MLSWNREETQRKHRAPVSVELAIGSSMPGEWFHSWLYPDGKPYKAEEILMVRDFKFQRPPEFANTQSFWSNGDSVSEIRDYETASSLGARSIRRTLPHSSDVKRYRNRLLCELALTLLEMVSVTKPH
jgi:hypothetical protein